MLKISLAQAVEELNQLADPEAALRVYPNKVAHRCTMCPAAQYLHDRTGLNIWTSSVSAREFEHYGQRIELSLRVQEVIRMLDGEA